MVVCYAVWCVAAQAQFRQQCVASGCGGKHAGFAAH